MWNNLSSLTIAGISKVDANLKEQLVSIEGTAPPSAIVAAIQDTGRDAILRGSGKSNSESAPRLLQTTMLDLDYTVQPLRL
jgi:copper chaperone for superoxide dismutase